MDREKVHVVKFTEHDSWSGEDVWYNQYDTYEIAKTIVFDTQSQLNKPYTPDVYVRAEYIGEVTKHEYKRRYQ